LYRTLLDIDEKEVKITDSDFETFNKWDLKYWAGSSVGRASGIYVP
jgi:hypothetical protein